MLETSRIGDMLVAHLSGELDHCQASSLRGELEEALKSPGITKLHLDLTGVTFMDSSGIGLIIGRYKTMQKRGGRVSAGGMNGEVDRLFRLGGLHRIIEVTEGRE